MKKEEILAKSRAENKDEGIEYAANKGRNYGVKALCAAMWQTDLFRESRIR